MIGWMLLRGAGSALSPPRGGAPSAGPSRVSPDSDAGRRSAVIGIVIFFTLIGPMCEIVYSGYEGHVSLRACVTYCVAFWGLLALALSVGALAGHVSGRATVRRYAAQAPPDRTAEGFRERAAQLRSLEAAGLWSVTARERRVADLFSVLCPVAGCRATAGFPCRLLPPGVPYAIVQRDPEEVCCHLPRIRDAVRFGTARVDDVVAQFNNNIPSGIL